MNYLSYSIFGPVIYNNYTQVEGYVSDAVSKGAEVIMGGARDETLGELFYKPSLLVNTTTEMRLTREEIFGPVVPVMK